MCEGEGGSESESEGADINECGCLVTVRGQK